MWEALLWRPSSRTLWESLHGVFPCWCYCKAAVTLDSGSYSRWICVDFKPALWWLVSIAQEHEPLLLDGSKGSACDHGSWSNPPLELSQRRARFAHWAVFLPLIWCVIVCFCFKMFLCSHSKNSCTTVSSDVFWRFKTPVSRHWWSAACPLAGFQVATLWRRRGRKDMREREGKRGRRSRMGWTGPLHIWDG